MCHPANEFLTANATRAITNITINLSLKLENFTEKGTPAQILTFLEKLNIQPKSHVTLKI